MLQLKQITKEYEIGKKNSKNYQTVKALNGVDLSFRESEFVSILGPSGCGKTTMLNIVGGLDKYTSGDLVIKGKSTKEFKDKDWDNYRNHSIGFVFQSYNLIHHQTILHNVELALTLSGVKRKERTARALEALDKVGLKDRANNLPNQLSGGQMQRVAIARAIVNDPDIILADEPTGALDSKTSVQIMEILKELSKTRLVIMVTHNPELAEQYSSRIVRLKDGELVDDTNPYNLDDEGKSKRGRKKSVEIDKIQEEKSEITKKPKKRMSFWTALSLSFKNLLTKKARTILVSFAGSIGIIGIALILAVSSGFTNYINKVQEDTLSNYPIVIEEQSVNYMNIVSSMFSTTDEDVNHNKDAVYTTDTLSSLLNTFANSLQSNDMKSFNAYLQQNYSKLEPHINAIQYGYDLNLNIYKDATSDPEFEDSLQPRNNTLYVLIRKYAVVFLEQTTKLDITENSDGSLTLKVIPDESNLSFFKTSTSFENIYNKLSTDGEYQLSSSEFTAIIGVLFKMNINDFKKYNLGLFNEMIDNPKFVQSQYNLLAGSWNSNQVYVENGKRYADTMLVLNENNELDDYLLYALGFISETEINKIFDAMLTETEYSSKVDYNSIVGTEFRVYTDDALYYHDGYKYTITDEDNPTISNANKDNYITLRISGIVRLDDNATAGALDEGLVYPVCLTNECINIYNNSDVVKSGTLLPIDKSSPKKISIYANSFHTKDIIEDFINEYNSGVDEEQKITYTDYVGLMMEGISSVIDIISYVLIAFVSVSLIVSSIMIGIITYISVLERTKEIGVLRSVGASKKDIKRVFTAESLIIGFSAGMMGILITLLLCIPINIIFKAFTGIGSLAALPVAGGIILVLISMLLTFIAGLIPAHVASKKDPVIALRTE